MSKLNHTGGILNEIAKRQQKINDLQKIVKSKSIDRVQIFFVADGRLQDINQSDTPFSLTSEIRLLIQESINQYESDIENLKLQF